MTSVVTVNTRRGKARVVDFDAVALRQELNSKASRDEVQRSLPRHEHYSPSAGWAKRLMISWPIDQWTLVPTEDWAHLIPADVTPDVVDKRGVCWKAHNGWAKVTPARGVIGTWLELERSPVDSIRVRVVLLDTHMVSSAWSSRRVPGKAWRKRKWLAHKRLLDHITEALTGAGFLVVLGGDFNRGVTLEFPGLVNPRQTKPAGIEAYDQFAASPDLDPRNFGRAGGKAGSDHYPQRMDIGADVEPPIDPPEEIEVPKLNTYGTDSSGRPILMSDYLLGWWEGLVYRLGFRPTIVQGSWMSQAGGGAGASAGYHDLGGALDLRVWDLTRKQVEAVLWEARLMGGDAFERGPKFPGGMDPHIHIGIHTDGPTHHGIQAAHLDYLAGGNGLSGSSHAPDPHPRPNPLVRTPPEGEFMPTADEIAKALRPVVAEEVAKATDGLPAAVWKVKGSTVKPEDRNPTYGRMVEETHRRAGDARDAARDEEPA